LLRRAGPGAPRTVRALTPRADRAAPCCGHGPAPAFWRPGFPPPARPEAAVRGEPCDCGGGCHDEGGAMSDTVAVEARITGRVQGVWYRGWTKGEATRRGLSGWVRNEPDGAVAALF